MSEILAAIDRIEAQHPGFQVGLAKYLVRLLWQRDPDALRDAAPELSALLEKNLMLLAERITRSWRIFDPVVRAALATEALAIAGPAPLATRHRREAKRQAIRESLWVLERDPHLQIETALCRAYLPDLRPLAKLTIWVAEQQLRQQAPLWARSKRPGGASDAALPEAMGQRLIKEAVSRAEYVPPFVDSADPEAVLLAQEDEAERERRLVLARGVIEQARLSELELDALIVVRVLEVPLAEWARETGRAPSTTGTYWARAQAKLQKATGAAGAS